MPAFVDVTFEEIKHYLIGVLLVLAVALPAFALSARVRRGVLSYVRNHVFFVSVFGVYVLVYVVARLILCTATSCRADRRLVRARGTRSE